MDLSSLKTADHHETGAEMQVANPITGELTDFYITLRGIDSVTFKKTIREKNLKAAEMLRENKQADTSDLDLEAMADLVVDWKGLEDDGKELGFTKKRAFDLFKNSPDIYDQCNMFIATRSNFTKA